MSIFSHYACYYDLLYRDRDYEGEADYVMNLIRAHRPESKKLCEFGCGTGRLAEILASRGYDIHGVDISIEMLARAEERKSILPPNSASRLSFQTGDIRTVELFSRFDAIVSMFHVISYLNEDEDLQKSFATAAGHLHPGGLFIFDFWYGPAVLTERPQPRIKRLEDERIRVVRFAEPCLHPERNVVDVTFHIIITDREAGVAEEFAEIHPMRYLFLPELRLMLASAGFESIDFFAHLTDCQPSLSTWGVCCVAKKTALQ